MSRLLGVSPQPLRAIAAIILTIASGFLIFCALRRTPWRRGAIDIDAPGAMLVLIQVLLTAIDVLAAAATLWVLLPSVGISFFAFAAIYCVALALGVLSHIPGGLGVFEVAILYAVGSSAPVDAVAAALVTYRGIYFLLPLLLSTLLLTNFELRRSLGTATGQRIGRAASDLAPLFLAATTFTVGTILVVSGAMPAFVDRLQILHIAIPLWAVEISHFLTSVAGLFLLFAAHGLYRRLDGAWWLALSMTLLGIPFSLIKGLAVVAPSVLAILLIGLVTARGQFSRRTSLLSQPMSLGWLIATGCVIAAMVWILFFAFRNVEYARELWWQFEFDAAGAACVACGTWRRVARLGGRRLAVAPPRRCAPRPAERRGNRSGEAHRCPTAAPRRPARAHGRQELPLLGFGPRLSDVCDARTNLGGPGRPSRPSGGMAGTHVAFHRTCRQPWWPSRLLSDTGIELAALSRRRPQNPEARRRGACFPALLHPRRLRSGRSPLCLEAW